MGREARMLMALFATSKELVASVGCEEGVGCGGKRDLIGSVSGNMICFFFPFLSLFGHPTAYGVPQVRNPI